VLRHFDIGNFITGKLKCSVVDVSDFISKSPKDVEIFQLLELLLSINDSSNIAQIYLQIIWQGDETTHENIIKVSVPS